MQIEKYDRKPFSVLAVQVNFENIHEVATWCKGTVIKQKAKMLGVNTDVPAVQLQGQGDSRGKAFIATLGCYIVELKGSFRVYKPGQFDSAFEKNTPDCSECTNGAEHAVHIASSEDKTYATDISLLGLQEKVTPETKAEWADDELPSNTIV